MSILDPIYAHALAARIIPKVSDEYARAIGLEPHQTSLGFMTADNDDALYVSIDEATKMADVQVVYAHSFYAGARHSSGIYSGEIIAMLAGSDPMEVKAGIDAAIHYLETKALWYSADAQNGVAFFPHVVSRIGSYFGSCQWFAAGILGGISGGTAARRFLCHGCRAQICGSHHSSLYCAAFGNELYGRYPDRGAICLRGCGPRVSGSSAGCRAASDYVLSWNENGER